MDDKTPYEVDRIIQIPSGMPGATFTERSMGMTPKGEINIALSLLIELLPPDDKEEIIKMVEEAQLTTV